MPETVRSESAPAPSPASAASLTSRDADRPGLLAYGRLARPDNWFKNVFVVPGALIAAELTNTPASRWIGPLAATLAVTCAIASANYVLNEWLDRTFDQHHPEKQNRPAVILRLSPAGVAVEYLLLALAGICGAYLISPYVLAAALALLAMGWVYNVPPARSKERPYLDVLSESINNPIRLLLGWFAVASSPLPPTSLVFSYWMGGAYLMGIKRYSEYRFFGDPQRAARYRRSFEHYTEDRLIVSSLLYALLAVSLGSVFLVKYRVELLVALPFVSVLFVWYFVLGLKPRSPVMHPEHMWREGRFAAYAVAVGLLIMACLTIRMPFLDWLLQSAFAVPSPR